MSVKNRQNYSLPNPFLLTFLILSLALGMLFCKDCNKLTRVGSTYKENCTNSNTTPAKNLRILINKTEIVSSSIINNNTIEYVWPNIQRISVVITCAYVDDESEQPKGVWSKQLIAETPPIKVNFSCTSHDFKYLKCHYEKPIHQECTTIEILPINCKQSPNESVNFCTLSGPDYDPINQDIYIFTVHSKNVFDDIFQNFSINHFDNVIPGKPNVSVTEIKPNSVILLLTMHDKLYLRTGLKYEIKLLQEFRPYHPYEKTTWNPTHSEQIQRLFEIPNLHAFKKYTIRVRSQSLASENSIDMWSQPITIEIKTPSKPPEIPPTIDAGGFYIGPDQDVHIYWKAVPDIEHNGDNFAYEIRLFQQNGHLVRGSEKRTKECTEVYHQPCTGCQFRLRSINDNGSSPEVFINIPRKDYPKPRRVRSTFDGATYQLSWDPPDTDEENLKNYTVSRCEFDGPNDRAVNCSKNFHFVRVGNTVGNFTFTKRNQFAVSANYLNGSSAMVWIDCIVPVASDIGSVTLHLNVLNSTTIYAYWVLTCVQKTLVKGQMIHYCESNMKTCSNIIIGPEREDIFISGLAPNTEYQIQVSIYSETINGSFSDFLPAKTQEEVSTAPRNLQICNISKDAIELVWMNPERLNGELRHYKVWYNDRYIQLTQKQYLMAQTVTYNLTNLKSYEDYRIYVTAETISDSERSNEVSVRTAISDPGLPQVKIEGNYFKTGWTSDKSSSSDMKILEISITNITHNQTEIRIVNATYDHEFNCSSCPACEYQISVRVVNVGFEKLIRECVVNMGPLMRPEIRDVVISFIDEKDFINLTELEGNLNRYFKDNDTMIRFVYGSWTTPVKHSCVLKGTPSMANFVIALPAVIVFPLLSVFVLYCFRKRYKIAKEIGIVLPKGLDSSEDANDDRNQAENMDACENHLICHGSSLDAYIDKSEILEDMFINAIPAFSTNREGYITRYSIPVEKEQLVGDEAWVAASHESEQNFASNGYVRPEDLISLEMKDRNPKREFSLRDPLNSDMFNSNGYVLQSALAGEKRTSPLSRNIWDSPTTATDYINPEELRKKYCPETDSFPSSIRFPSKNNERPTMDKIEDTPNFTECSYQQKLFGSDGYIVTEDLQSQKPRMRTKRNKPMGTRNFHPEMFNADGYIVTRNTFLDEGYLSPKKVKNMKIPNQ